MLDRKKYEEELQRAREQQMEDISNYLKKYIELNAKVRDMDFTPDESKELLEEVNNIEIPRNGRDVKEIGDELIDKVFSNAMLIQHPKFLSFVTSAVSPYSLAGSILTDIFNLNMAGFSLAPSANIIEQKLIKWLGSFAGFGDKCGGLFTSGGSLSNLTGMIAARTCKLTDDELPLGVAYCSDQAHSSIKKGLKLMGIRKDNIRIIPTDDDYKIDVKLLEEAIKKDIDNGKKPFLIIGSIGTTNTGSIDDLQALGEIKNKYDMWLHIDGAYGGSVLFSDIYRNYAKGVENADTLSWDMHKWALQTYSCSCLIAKNKQNLITTYAEHPEYLADIINEEHNDGWDLGIEMSRPARCIKLWFTVQAMGTDLLKDVIDYSFFNCKVAQKQLEKYSDFEITSNPMCGTITFRYAPKDVNPEKYDELNSMISETIIDNDYAYVVTTLIKNKRVLRLNIINGNTTDQDVIEVIDKLNEIAVSLKEQYK